MDIVGNFEKIRTFLSGYPTWVKWLCAGWSTATVALAASLIVMKQSGASFEPSGDPVIDTATLRLEELRKKDPAMPDQQVADALRPLFSRPAFYGIREENWEYFLFIICQTRFLLEQHIQYFNSSNTRSKLGKAVTKMVQLQNDVAQIYGPIFQ